ncbi:hypothetical protein [Candidatus Caldatribacterium sp.]|uniref:hypothetical protein n=1 Tax=Candidatus Caldatribacterium sp. TaxID=2282143 RepID=UPI0029914A4F|nr:hypothetical protein [Candidatus Caldatribacterium sp.]MDW8081428.1 hypothetical protein [Candidatus Calescibacterium sp.]
MAKETLVNWRENLPEIRIPLYVLPARLSGWYEDEAWVACPPYDLRELARKLPKRGAFILLWELYAPPSPSPLSEGEIEHILTTLEDTIGEFLYSLAFYEKIARNYRFMFFLCLVAYIIGLLSVNTWWFIWFRQPYLAFTGVDNWWKRKQFSRFTHCRFQEISRGEDVQRQEMLAEVLSFFRSLSPGDPEYLEKMIAFAREKEREHSAFSEIRRAYEYLRKREKDKSYFLKRVPHTLWTKVKRFFLGDLLLIPAVFAPFLCVPVRDLSFVPIPDSLEGQDAQNRALQAV